MKIKFYIPTPDDRDTFNTTSFLLSCSLTKQDMSKRRYRSLRHNKYGEIPIRISKPHIGGGYKIDPLNKKISEGYLVSRGEYLTAKLMSEYLGYYFLDSAKSIFVDFGGTVKYDQTSIALKEAFLKH